MQKSDVTKYQQGTAEYVVTHALWQKSRGRRPSMAFCGFNNPRKALELAKRFAYFPASGSYLNGKIPLGYNCGKCGAVNCKLWRDYNTFLENQRLLCAPCAAEDQKKEITNIDADGKRTDNRFGFKTDQIGCMVPAVPTEECDTYWGYTSVPTPGVNWWKNLPTLPTYRLLSF